MSVGTPRPATRTGVSTGKVGASVFLDYLLSNLGYYTLLPVLPLLLAQARQSSPWLVGAALFTLAFAVRAACIPLSALLHQVDARLAMVAGLLVASAGFAVFAVVASPAAELACLAIAGTGISVNTLMARAYITIALQMTGSRNTAFSAIQVGVNVAAAVGPIAANVLYGSHRQVLCLMVVAVLYAVAAVVVGAVVPSGFRPSSTDSRRPSVRSALRVLLAAGKARRLVMVTVTGWFLYGQLFSALTLHIGAITASPLLRASFFTANAVLVVLVQIPVTALSAGRLEAGAQPVAFLLMGIAIFGAAFLSMAVAGALVAGTFAAIAIFSVAETFFTPFVATAFAELPGGRPVLEGFALLQVAMAIGEPLGAFSGGSLYSLAAGAGLGAAYWVVLGALALLVVVLGARSGRRQDRQPARH